MLTSVSIRNFRGFADLVLNSLGRVNLIGGRNNVGKTSLLEGLFLYAGPNMPDIGFRVNVIRGLGVVSLDAGEMWGSLFHKRDTQQEIRVITRGENGQERTIKIRLAEHAGARLETTGGKGAAAGGDALLLKRDLTFEYVGGDGKPALSKAFIEGDSLRLEGMRPEPDVPAIYLSSRHRNPQEDAGRFSKLDAKNRSGEVVAVLRLIEPDLRRLSIRVMGNSAMVQADIGLGEAMPLPLMGDGMVRLLSIILGIADVPGGLALVDEVENGVHHSAMKGVWLAIAAAARQAGVQVFATTHSRECIQAAHEAFSESGPYDLRVHRLERVKGDIRAVTFDQNTLGTALAQGWEVR